MMSFGIEIILLVFALIGYIGAGASLAVARYRALEEGRSDLGMLGVAAMLFMFGAVCTSVAAGVLGVVAIGGLAVWVSYIVMARQIGLFLVEVSTPREAAPAEAPRSPTS